MTTPSTAIPPILTERLHLVSLSLECLRALRDGDSGVATVEGGCAIPADSGLRSTPWVGRRLRLIEADPTQHAWMYRAIVRASDGVMVGYISFHHKAPDPDLLAYSDRAAELGYTIEPEYRRRGYAKESARAMMEWASQQHGCETFILSISPTNIPSLKLAQSLHFRKVAERMDEIDGLEETYLATLADIRSAEANIHNTTPEAGEIEKLGRKLS